MASASKGLLRNIELARDLIDEEEYEAAEGSLENLLQKHPDAPEIHHALGDLAIARGDFARAIDHFLDAARLHPAWAEPLLAAAHAELARNNHEGAIELGERIATTWAHDEHAVVEALELVASAHGHLDRSDEARAALARIEALALDDAMLIQRLADARLRADDLDGAARAYRRVLARDPRDADALHGLGACLHAQGAREAATEAWLGVRALDLAKTRPERTIESDALADLGERTLRELAGDDERLATLAVVVDDAPSEELVREGVDPRAVCRITADGAVLYFRRLEVTCALAYQVADEVRAGLRVEAARHFA